MFKERKHFPCHISCVSLISLPRQIERKGERKRDKFYLWRQRIHRFFYVLSEMNIPFLFFTAIHLPKKKYRQTDNNRYHDWEEVKEQEEKWKCSITASTHLGNLKSNVTYLTLFSRQILSLLVRDMLPNGFSVVLLPLEMQI